MRYDERYDEQRHQIEMRKINQIRTIMAELKTWSIEDYCTEAESQAKFDADVDQVEKYLALLELKALLRLDHNQNHTSFRRGCEWCEWVHKYFHGSTPVRNCEMCGGYPL